MVKHLVSLSHRTRCDRSKILPMLEKLAPDEAHALWHWLIALQEDAEQQGRRR